MAAAGIAESSDVADSTALEGDMDDVAGTGWEDADGSISYMKGVVSEAKATVEAQRADESME